MFISDLHYGKQAEEEVLLILKQYGFEGLKKIEGNFKDYDLIGFYKGNSFTFEIKSDRKSAITGNVVIEYSHNNFPSGINTTKADYWIIKIANEYYITTPRAIKALVLDKNYKKVSGGDYKTTLMLLFKKDYFIQTICKKLI